MTKYITVKMSHFYSHIYQIINDLLNLHNKEEKCTASKKL